MTPTPVGGLARLPGVLTPPRRADWPGHSPIGALTVALLALAAAACSSVDSDSAAGGVDASYDGADGDDSAGDGGDEGDPLPPDAGTDDGSGGDGDGDGDDGETIPVDCSEDEATAHFVQSENRIGTRWVSAAVRSMVAGSAAAPAGGPPTVQGVLDLYSFPHVVPSGAGLDVSTLVWRSPFATEDRWVFQLAISAAPDYARSPLDVIIAVGVSTADGEKIAGRTSAALADTLSLLAPGDRVTVISGTTVKLLAHEVTAAMDEVVASALATSITEAPEDDAAVIDAAYAIAASNELPAFSGPERRVLFVGRDLAAVSSEQLELVSGLASGEDPIRFLGVAVGEVSDAAAGFDELAAAGAGRAIYVTESQASPKRTAALRAGLFAAANDISLDVELPPGLALAGPQWAEANLPVAPPDLAGTGDGGLTPSLPGPSLLSLGVGETVVLQRTLVGCGSRLDGPTPIVVFADWSDGATSTATSSEFAFDLAQAGASTEANATEGLRLHKARIVVGFADVLTSWASGATDVTAAERTLALLDSIEPSLPDDTELAEIRAAVEALLSFEKQQDL